MTKLAKILVFLNFALGVGMFAWALGIYTNRIDFSNAKGVEGKPDGELKIRADRIAVLADNLNKGAVPRWTGARTRLAAAEQMRVNNQKFYAVQLLNLASGGPPLVPPIQIGRAHV